MLEVDLSDQTVLIHFEGWNQRYDEWVPMHSDKLRPLTRTSDRKKNKSKSSGVSCRFIQKCVMQTVTFYIFSKHYICSVQQF